MEEKIYIGCEIFVIKDDQLLLGKRKNCYGGGSWGLPGGHLEIGEKLIDAAQRELKEELNIENSQPTLKTITDDTSGDKHYVHITFSLNNFVGKYQLMESEKCEEWRFFPLNNLPDSLFVAHRRILETFKEDKLYFF